MPGPWTVRRRPFQSGFEGLVVADRVSLRGQPRPGPECVILVIISKHAVISLRKNIYGRGSLIAEMADIRLLDIHNAFCCLLSPASRTRDSAFPQ